MDNLKQALSNKRIHIVNSSNYYSQIDSAVKDMKSASKQMEKENMMMEQKLSDLKNKLRGEMESRKQSGGPRWRSSEQQYNRSKKTDYSSVKVLRDVPVEKYIQKKPDKKTDKKPFERQKIVVSASRRRHTAATSATTTTSTNEYYPQKPTTRPVVANNTKMNFMPSPPRSKSKEQGGVREESSLLYGEYNEKENAQSFKDALKDWRNSGGNTTSSTCSERNEKCETSVSGQGDVGGGVREESSLLYGEYNEKENAQSFKDALKEWRNSGDNTTSSTCSERNEKCEASVSVQSESVSCASDIASQIKFNSSLSYMEKLMLKKHKHNDQLFQRESTITPPTSRLYSGSFKNEVSFDSSCEGDKQNDTNTLYYSNANGYVDDKNKDKPRIQSNANGYLDSLSREEEHAQSSWMMSRDSLSEDVGSDNAIIERDWRRSYVGMEDYFQLGVGMVTQDGLGNNNNNNNDNKFYEANADNVAETDDEKFVSALRQGVWNQSVSF